MRESEIACRRLSHLVDSLIDEIAVCSSRDLPSSLYRSPYYPLPVKVRDDGGVASYIKASPQAPRCRFMCRSFGALALAISFSIFPPSAHCTSVCRMPGLEEVAVER